MPVETRASDGHGNVTDARGRHVGQPDTAHDDYNTDPCGGSHFGGPCSGADPRAAERDTPGLRARLPGDVRERSDRWHGVATVPAPKHDVLIAGMSVGRRRPLVGRRAAVGASGFASSDEAGSGVPGRFRGVLRGNTPGWWARDVVPARARDGAVPDVSEFPTGNAALKYFTTEPHRLAGSSAARPGVACVRIKQ